MSFSLLMFLVGAAVGGYFQTMIGFAMGMVIMSFTVSLGAMSVSETAIALNVLSVTNASIVLPRIWRRTDWSGVLKSLGGLLPGVAVGLMLLNRLSAERVDLLHMLIGGLIICGGLALILRPQPRSTRSGALSFVIAGAASGLLGGLSSIAGPPMVYHYYRQPGPVITVRATLLTAFALLAVARLLFVGIQSDLEVEGLKVGALAVPVVIVSSWLCTRFPPPVSEHAVRRMAFIVLIAMGSFIAYTGIVDSLQGVTTITQPSRAAEARWPLAVSKLYFVADSPASVQSDMIVMILH